VKNSSQQILFGALLCSVLASATIARNTTAPAQLGADRVVETDVPADHRIDRRALVKRHNITLNHVLKAWDWPSTWGWDYPMLAMTAARLGEPEKAVDALFINSQKNRYLANGHNFQSSRLPLYLPGNGGLLTAVAMMTAGWDGCPDRPSPGFPNNGEWTIHWEGLKRMP